MQHRDPRHHRDAKSGALSADVPILSSLFDFVLFAAAIVVYLYRENAEVKCARWRTRSITWFPD